jgi:hypothetical protein
MQLTHEVTFNSAARMSFKVTATGMQTKQDRLDFEDEFKHLYDVQLSLIQNREKDAKEAGRVPVKRGRPRKQQSIGEGK